MYGRLARFCRQLSQTGHGKRSACRDAVRSITSNLFCSTNSVMCIPRVICARTCAMDITIRDFLPFSTSPANPANEANQTIRHSLDIHTPVPKTRMWAVGSTYYKRDSLSLRTNRHRSFPRFVALAIREGVFFVLHEQHRKIAWIFVSNLTPREVSLITISLFLESFWFQL